MPSRSNLPYPQPPPNAANQPTAPQKNHTTPQQAPLLGPPKQAPQTNQPPPSNKRPQNAPPLVIHQLPQQLQRRLRPVRLKRRHVEVVHKHDGPGAKGGAVDAAAALVQLGVDYVLGLVGVGWGWGCCCLDWCVRGSVWWNDC